jgi:hypothetical protein
VTPDEQPDAAVLAPGGVLEANDFLHRHRDERGRAVDGGQRAGGPRLVRRRQPAAAAAVVPGQLAEQARRRGAPTCKLAAVVDVRARAVLRRASRGARSALGRPVAPATDLPRRHRRGARPPLRERASPAPAAGRGTAPRRHPGRARAAARPARRGRSSSTPRASTCTSSAASSRPSWGVESGPSLRMAVMSFGFKYGVPLDADFVFDMRFLPNPFWVPELKALTGVGTTGRRLGAGPGPGRRSSSMPWCTDGARHRGYLAEGRRYATVGDRLHRRQAPLRRDDRSDGGSDSRRSRWRPSSSTVTWGASDRMPCRRPRRGHGLAATSDGAAIRDRRDHRHRHRRRRRRIERAAA